MRILPHKYLRYWRVNDPEWVAQRKAEWKIIQRELFRDGTASDISASRKYFMSGISADYITTNETVLFTPLTSGELYREFLLESGLFVKSEVRSILNSHIQSTSKASNMSWYRNHSKLYADAFYRNGYSEFKMVDPAGQEHKITPDVTYIFKCFLVGWTQILEFKAGYTGYVEMTDFVVSALPYANRQSMRKKLNRFNYIDEMLSAAESALKVDATSEEIKRYANDILSLEQSIRNSWALNSDLDVPE